MNSNFSEKEFNFKNANEWVGFFVAVTALLGIVGAIVIKYISLGRCLYFGFDIDYFDFSLSNSSKFVLILYIVACLISTLLSMSYNIICINFLKTISKRPHKIIFMILIFLTSILCIVFLSIRFIPDKILSRFFCFLQ